MGARFLPTAYNPVLVFTIVIDEEMQVHSLLWYSKRPLPYAQLHLLVEALEEYAERLREAGWIPETYVEEEVPEEVEEEVSEEVLEEAKEVAEKTQEGNFEDFVEVEEAEEELEEEEEDIDEEEGEEEEAEEEEVGEHERKN